MPESHRTAGYRTHPVHRFPALDIRTGHDALAAAIASRLGATGGAPVAAIDGYVGVEWAPFIAALRARAQRAGVVAAWLDAGDALLPPATIADRLAPALTDDPVFGRLAHSHLEDLWDAAVAERLRRACAAAAGPTIVFGYGASLLAPGGVQVYLEVPKDLTQRRAAQGRIVNVGAGAAAPTATMYKRLYFVDWPMLNRIKRGVLPRLDLFVDASESAEPRVVSGEAFRRALHDLAGQPFRVKPWFAPGPWGGQWMKERFGLPPEQPNYAWSFELIAPENGVLLGDGVEIVECAFDYPLWQETDAILGAAVAARYGSYFPIRLDYLDTMGGTNLSCQVHPRLDYMREEFGEPFTQDETYYIVECAPDARVFLGLRDDADVARFRAAAEAARDQKRPFEIADHVNCLPSRPHDLFLIPSGTVHCSGADNLVLEISATPYIYTFKIYDYLRSDLQGNPRHVHVDRAFANLEPRRSASYVRAHLTPAPALIRGGDGWAEYRVGDIDELFFAIHRLEFDREIDDRTGGRFLALNVVEGERCEIVVEGRPPVELRFAESIVIPAALDRYTLRNTGAVPCKVVKAFVKI